LTTTVGVESDRDAEPGIQPRPAVLDILRQVYRRMLAQNIDDRAAALSYYFLFALFPTLLFVAALVGTLPESSVMHQLMIYIDTVLPGDAGALVARTLAEVVRGAGPGLISLGALGALWGASNGMVSIMSALNVARGVIDDRAWWKRRLVALGLTLGFSLFTVIAASLLVFGEWIGAAVAAWMGLGPLFTQAWNRAQWPGLVLCVLTGITLVYTLAPAQRPRWRSVSPGAVVALVGWLVMSFGLRVYVRFFDAYNATYGSIGGVILLMLWLYLSSLFLLIGAEINAVVEQEPRRPG
jgi:membrane protein